MTAPEGGRRGSARAEEPSAPRALLVMGEALGNLAALTLRHGRFETRTSTDPAELRRVVAEWQPHLAMIDVDRYERLIEIIANGPTPILAFTRKREVSVKLRAFEKGADDIVEVPFTLDEIVARPFALMRRIHGLTIPLAPKIKLDGLEVDVITQKVRVNGDDLSLSPIQQALLYLLAANAGTVLSREDILTTIWGADFETESNVVDRHIRELRVKLKDDWRTPRFIETVAGAGYRFKPQDGNGISQVAAG